MGELETSDGWLSKANKTGAKVRQIVVSGTPLVNNGVGIAIDVGYAAKIVWRSDGHGMVQDDNVWSGGIWWYTDMESWATKPLIAGHPPFPPIADIVATKICRFLPPDINAGLEHGRNILNWLGVRPLVTYEVMEFVYDVAQKKVTGTQAWRAVKIKKETK